MSSWLAWPWFSNNLIETLDHRSRPLFTEGYWQSSLRNNTSLFIAVSAAEEMLRFRNPVLTRSSRVAPRGVSRTATWRVHPLSERRSLRPGCSALRLVLYLELYPVSLHLGLGVELHRLEHGVDSFPLFGEVVRTRMSHRWQHQEQTTCNEYVQRSAIAIERAGKVVWTYLGQTAQCRPIFDRNWRWKSPFCNSQTPCVIAFSAQPTSCRLLSLSSIRTTIDHESAFVTQFRCCSERPMLVTLSCRIRAKRVALFHPSIAFSRN